MLITATIDANADATGADSATFEITHTKSYVSIVTLSAEHNAKLSKLLSKEFKRSVYWNKYKVIDNIEISINDANEEKYIRERLDASYQGVKRLFIPAYDNKTGNNQVCIDFFKKYFLPRGIIENYIIKIDGRIFYDQSINDSIKQYGKVREISTGEGDDYTTRSLLEFCVFGKKLQSNCYWFEQTKSFGCWFKSNSIIFTGKTKSAEENTRVIIYYIFEQSKEAILEFWKGTTKVL